MATKVVEMQVSTTNKHDHRAHGHLLPTKLRFLAWFNCPSDRLWSDYSKKVKDEFYELFGKRRPCKK